jgi:hypothetical protein
MSISSVVHVAPQFFGPDAVLCSALDPYETTLDMGRAAVGQTHRAVMRVACRSNVPALKTDILNETRMFVEASPPSADIKTSVTKYGHAAVKEFADSTVLQLVHVFQIEINWTPSAHAEEGVAHSLALKLMYPDRRETMFRWNVTGSTLEDA